jgi:nucleoid DNA-binding protein
MDGAYSDLLWHKAKSKVRSIGVERIFLWILSPDSGFFPRHRRRIKMAKAKVPAKEKAKKLTKGALIQALLDGMGEDWSRKSIKDFLDALTQLGHNELKKKGEFVLPGFAKFVVVKKPARPARQGINPFTKEPTTFAAKPAKKVVKARAVKALKDSIG